MAKKEQDDEREPQDLTLRNLRALKKLIDEAELKIDQLAGRIKILEAKLVQHGWD